MTEKKNISIITKIYNAIITFTVLVFLNVVAIMYIFLLVTLSIVSL